MVKNLELVWPVVNQPLVTSMREVKRETQRGKNLQRRVQLKLVRTRPQGYKTFSLLNSAEHEIVGILTFFSMINTTSERFKAIHFFNCRYFSFYEMLKFCAQLS